MPQIRPFAGIHFSKKTGSDISRLISPPFDVLDEKSKAALQAYGGIKRIAFLSDRDGSQQIYVISPAGGEATELAHFEGPSRPISPRSLRRR